MYSLQIVSNQRIIDRFNHSIELIWEAHDLTDNKNKQCEYLVNSALAAYASLEWIVNNLLQNIFNEDNKAIFNTEYKITYKGSSLPAKINLLMEHLKPSPEDSNINFNLLKELKNPLRNEPEHSGKYPEYGPLIIVLEEIKKVILNYIDSNAKIQSLLRSSIESKESIADDDLHNLVNIFIRKSYSLYTPTNDELARLYNFKVKLYNQIFEQFDKKINESSKTKSKITEVLFERILSIHSLESQDLDIIQNIRRNTNYFWYERTLIVSALSLSLAYQLDLNKANLLLDFLSDFESSVWKRALIGLVLVSYS